MDEKELMKEFEKDQAESRKILQAIHDVLSEQRENAEIEKVVRSVGIAGACCSIMQAIGTKNDGEFGMSEMVEFSQCCVRIGAYVALARRDFDKLMGDIDINLDDLG